MTKAEEITLKLHQYLANELDWLIDYKRSDYNDKDRLRYAKCLNDKEKLEVTKRQIKKMQKKLDKCDIHIAGYISALIIEGNTERCNNYEQLRKDICYNFLSDYCEEIDFISKDYKTLKSLEKEDQEFWQEILTDESNVFTSPNINNFIKFMVIADRLDMYKDFLNIDVKTEENLSKGMHNIFKDENFVLFLKGLEYNYPYQFTPISSYHQWKSNLKSLKMEILSNLVTIQNETRKPYLKKILFEIEEHIKYAYVKVTEVDELYKYYKTNESNLLHDMSYTNEMHIILNSEPSKYKIPEGNNYEVYPKKTQEIFYNYHYGNIINEAVIFIKEQIADYDKPINKNQISFIESDIKRSTTLNYLSLSFKYTNSDSTRLTDLMNALKSNKFIETRTQLRDFRKVFSGEEIEKPIVWIGTLPELAYLVKSIHTTFAKLENTKQQIWKITTKCFVQESGKQFDKTKFRGQKPPASKEIIEKIAKIL